MKSNYDEYLGLYSFQVIELLLSLVMVLGKSATDGSVLLIMSALVMLHPACVPECGEVLCRIRSLCGSFPGWVSLTPPLAEANHDTQWRKSPDGCHVENEGEELYQGCSGGFVLRPNLTCLLTD